MAILQRQLNAKKFTFLEIVLTFILSDETYLVSPVIFSDYIIIALLRKVYGDFET